MKNVQHKALWRDFTKSPSFTSLKGTVQVDTVVVGAGVTGLTTAWHLAQAGQRVAVVDMGNVGSGETGKTTGHVTALTDGGTSALREKHGDAAAAQVVQAQLAAIGIIEACCKIFGPSTRFRRVPAYLYSENTAGVKKVEDEFRSLKAVGVGTERLGRAPLPFATQAALRLQHQAQFQPMAYLAAMARAITDLNGQIFTDSRVRHVEDGSPCKVATAEGEVHARNVVLATHTPPNRLAYHTQIFAYRTYALTATCRSLPDPGLYFDTDEPYHYIRTQDTVDGDVLLIGGQDHKTGKQDGDANHLKILEAFTRDRFPVEQLRYAWSGQIMEPADLLPYVGLNGSDKHVLFASGYSGSGITLGTISAGIMSDMILGRENVCADLFSSQRVNVAQVGAIVRENIDVPTHMVGDRAAALARSEGTIEPGEGRVFTRKGKAVAVCLDSDGTRHEFSAVCPHMGCLVNWNKQEKSWDCPCHGSRFSGQGKLLNGPALEDLKNAD